MRLSPVINLQESEAFDMASERIQGHIDRLLKEVDEAVSILDWVGVRDRAQAVLAFDPNNGDALAFITAAERALGCEVMRPLCCKATGM